MTEPKMRDIAPIQLQNLTGSFVLLRTQDDSNTVYFSMNFFADKSPTWTR